MKYRLSEISWLQAKKILGRAIALVPIGCLEQHGIHLPLSTDTIITEAIVERASELASPTMTLVICPTINYGYAMHNMDFPGTITLNYETLINMGIEVCSSLVHHGCWKIVLISCHGSNASPLDLISRKVMNSHPNVLVAAVNPFRMAAKEIEEFREAKELGGMSHACELETSLVLALKKDLVEMRKAKKDLNQPLSNFYYRDITKGGRGVSLADLTRNISKTGTVGDPTKATEAKGEKFLKIIVDVFVDFLKEFQKRKIEKKVNFKLSHPKTQIE